MRSIVADRQAGDMEPRHRIRAVSRLTRSRAVWYGALNVSVSDQQGSDLLGESRRRPSVDSLLSVHHQHRYGAARAVPLIMDEHRIEPAALTVDVL